ncbi:hypothetical protein BLNAU_8280 [Blattamonas nauphoetae]|uniref:Uncharacterized protein n=1 Tax=Blattamonas nauphoetae TaxID=2049346 RepID=A0ABQ9X238_9EUKA|nr:hypothetical protein BLNAU_19935 [Blattamonas nauphoetae]KAK2945833.1 hypothetical protein BLNAU_19258 [Blattamonas nauphoetae]KAK2956826.1 hypothetical protein BLNAU_8280 [Blattamonas nauphoetae]
MWEGREDNALLADYALFLQTKGKTWYYNTISDSLRDEGRISREREWGGESMELNLKMHLQIAENDREDASDAQIEFYENMRKQRPYFSLLQETSDPSRESGSVVEKSYEQLLSQHPNDIAVLCSKKSGNIKGIFLHQRSQLHRRCGNEFVWDMTKAEDMNKTFDIVTSLLPYFTSYGHTMTSLMKTVYDSDVENEMWEYVDIPVATAFFDATTNPTIDVTTADRSFLNLVADLAQLSTQIGAMKDVPMSSRKSTLELSRVSTIHTINCLKEDSEHSSHMPTMPACQCGHSSI